MVTRRHRTLLLGRRHPRGRTLSCYLEGDLDPQYRRALGAHLRDCERCRRALASLEETIHALGSLQTERPAGLADSILAALRAESPPATATATRPPKAASLPTLTLVPGSGRTPVAERIAVRWPRQARAAVCWCLRRAQLRFTLPITVVAGVVLSLVNMGGMLMHGRIDLGVCVSCTIDFLVPFLALNLGLLMLLWVPRRRRRPGS
jgi:anti-sigma factor RsiW